MVNLFSKFKDTVRKSINTFNNIKSNVERKLNTFHNYKIIKFLKSPVFGNITKSGSEILVNNQIISRKTEDRARNLVDMLSELKQTNYGNALNYGSSIFNDFADKEHFREGGRRRFLDRIEPLNR